MYKQNKDQKVEIAIAIDRARRKMKRESYC